MSRIVVSSDYHLDACTAGVPRLSDVAAAINETVDVAIEHKVDAWGFLGDAMDPDSGSIVFDCMEVLFEAVIRLQHEGIETFLIGGNHDCKEDGSGTTTLSPLRPLSARSDSIHLYEQPGAFKLATGLSVVALPYTASSHAYDTAKFLKEAVSKLDGDYIIASHLNLEGIHPGSESTDMPRGREVFFPFHVLPKLKRQPKLMLNGHIHKQQVYRDVHIPGSLVRLSFGEESNTPGYLIIEV